MKLVVTVLVFRDDSEREEDQITEGNFLIPVLNPQVILSFGFCLEFDIQTIFNFAAGCKLPPAFFCATFNF